MIKKTEWTPTKCVCIDVDGTLWINGTLNKKLCQWAKLRKKEGYDVILWSARGRIYAEKFAKKNKIESLFTFIIGKPSYIVDDKGWAWISYTKTIKTIF